jgi:hypothetical protein
MLTILLLILGWMGTGFFSLLLGNWIFEEGATIDIKDLVLSWILGPILLLLLIYCIVIEFIVKS